MIRIRCACFVTALVPFFVVASPSFAQNADNPLDTSGTAMAANSESIAPESSHFDTVSVSKVRIVRLSEVKGEVQVDRNTGNGFEAAMTNLPIVEKDRVRTDDGVAEVEFEDNSTLRLAPNTVVAFTQLGRAATGATLSSADVLRGTVYVSVLKTKGNEFHVTFGDRRMELPPESHVRIAVGDPETTVAVLQGNVSIEGPSGPVSVAHKQTATFMFADPPQVAKKIEEQPFDSWDENATQYHEHVAMVSSLRSSPYAYGAQDLSYYGSFSDAGGCGSMWRPYFASAAWDPFGNGAWAYYPGAGYSWVSPYPWGWMPYHSGNWAYCPSMGWGWQPGGGGFMGLNNSALLVHSMTPGRTPHPLPPKPPRAGQPTLQAVNLKPLTTSGYAVKNSQPMMEFRRDSAGMGIPRGLGKLNELSRQTVSRGVATTSIYVTGPRSTMTMGRGPATATAGGAAYSVHRGMAPAASYGAERGYERGGASGWSGGGVNRGGVSSGAAPVRASSPSMGGSGGAPSGGGTRAH